MYMSVRRYVCTRTTDACVYGCQSWCLMIRLCSLRTFLLTHLIYFFFSSRRRHTRFDCDWSSDVCSSDLGYVTLSAPTPDSLRTSAAVLPASARRRDANSPNSPRSERSKLTKSLRFSSSEIGRASCRERV